MLKGSVLVILLVAFQKGRMGKTIETVQTNFNSVRTGRANPAMLDKIEVWIYMQVCYFSYSVFRTSAFEKCPARFCLGHRCHTAETIDTKVNIRHAILCWSGSWMIQRFTLIILTDWNFFLFFMNTVRTICVTHNLIRQSMVIYGCVVIMKSECVCVHEAKILTYHTYVPKHTLVGGFEIIVPFVLFTSYLELGSKRWTHFKFPFKPGWCWTWNSSALLFHKLVGKPFSPKNPVSTL